MCERACFGHGKEGVLDAPPTPSTPLNAPPGITPSWPPSLSIRTNATACPPLTASCLSGGVAAAAAACLNERTTCVQVAVMDRRLLVSRVRACRCTLVGAVGNRGRYLLTLARDRPTSIQLEGWMAGFRFGSAHEATNAMTPHPVHSRVALYSHPRITDMTPRSSRSNHVSQRHDVFAKNRGQSHHADLRSP